MEIAKLNLSSRGAGYGFSNTSGIDLCRDGIEAFFHLPRNSRCIDVLLFDSPSLNRVTVEVRNVYCCWPAVFLFVDGRHVPAWHNAKDWIRDNTLGHGKVYAEVRYE